MASYLRESVTLLQDLGFLNTLLPFFFAYVIVYATLEKTRVLGVENGKPKSNLNAMVAFCLGFFFIASLSLVANLIVFLQYLAMGLVFVICVMFGLAAWFGDSIKFEGNKYAYFFGSMFIIGIFLAAIGLLNQIPFTFILGIILNPLTLVVVIFAGIMWYISGSGSGNGNNDEGDKQVTEELKKRGAKPVGANMDDYYGSL